MLQKKLAKYAEAIGQWGLGAAVLATSSMVFRFTLDTFALGGEAWDVAFLQTYLQFFITGVTILVSVRMASVMRHII